MKICPSCSRESPIIAQYCIHCGHQLTSQEPSIQSVPLTCVKCNKANPHYARFCIKCGQPLNFTPQQLIENDLRSYWYCTNEKEIMIEISQTHQFKLTKDIDQSVEQLEREGKIKSKHKLKAKEIGEKFLQADPEMKFPLLTRVRCPICMEESVAPIHFRPGDSR